VATGIAIAFVSVVGLGHVWWENRPKPETTDFNKGELGLLDYVPEGLRAMEEYAASMKRITKSMSNTGPRLVRANKCLQAEKNPFKSQKIAAEAARVIEEFRQVLIVSLPSLGNSAATFAQAMLGHVKSVSLTSEDERSSLLSFREVVRTLLAETEELKSTTAATKDSALVLRRRNVSMALNGAADRLQKPLADYVGVLELVQQGCRQVVSGIDQRLK
jgi:hypothetical protein